jgi:hypothetical protein
VSRHDDQLASHIQQLGNHELNELLVQLPPSRFAALVDAALLRPVLPAGLRLRFESVPGVDGWGGGGLCPASAARQHHPRPGPQRPGQVAGLDPHRQSSPARRRRLLAPTPGCWHGPGLGHPSQRGPVPGPGRPRLRPPGPQLQDLLAGLPQDRSDQLLEAAFASDGAAA